MSERIAVIDLGSNSARLIILHIYANGAYNLVYHQKESLRLGEGMGRDQLLQPAAIERSLAALRNIAQMCRIMLQDDEHDRRQRDHPEQRIAEFRSGSHIRSPVSRIDEADRDEYTRSDIFQKLSRTAASFMTYLKKFPQIFHNNTSSFLFFSYSSIILENWSNGY